MLEDDFVQAAFDDGFEDRLISEASEAYVVNDKARRRANLLDGKTWTKYSISIWSDIRKMPEEIQLRHPAMFPLALATRLIEIFTNSDDRVVLDPFVGIGTTVVAAKRLGKHGIGIELNPEFADTARYRGEQKGIFDVPGGQATIYTDDAANLLEYMGEGSVDLVITSPPYWDILTEKRTADYKEIRNYGDYDRDLGRIASYEEFLRELKQIFGKVYQVLRNGAYCCVIVMDIRKKGHFFPFHSDVARFMIELGFVYDDLIIWDRRHEYNNMRPLGYPYVFRVNKAHEFILIFQKPWGAQTNHR